MIIMQGKRRVGRKEGEFLQSLGLFRELIQLVNTKATFTIPETYSPKRKIEMPPIQKKTVNVQSKQQLKQQQKERKLQKMQKIRLRSWRDWQGLCSQRKEDVFGQYAVCFEYSMVEEAVKNIDNPENGIFLNHLSSNT